MEKNIEADNKQDTLGVLRTQIKSREFGKDSNSPKATVLERNSVVRMLAELSNEKFDNGAESFYLRGLSRRIANDDIVISKKDVRKVHAIYGKHIIRRTRDQ